MNRMRVPKSNSGHSINSLPAYTSLFDSLQPNLNVKINLNLLKLSKLIIYLIF
jgi:hypothetical protein